MFEVHVKRHRWNVTEGETKIAVAVDVGKARKVDVIAAAHLGRAYRAVRHSQLDASKYLPLCRVL